MLNERLGWIHFILTFVGFHLTFMVQHVLGLEGMPRRMPDVHGAPTGWGALNLDLHDRRRSCSASPRSRSCGTCGARTGTARSPGATRGTPRPSSGRRRRRPSPENWDQPLPPIRSERPLWDANHPDAKATVPTDGAGELPATGAPFQAEVVLYAALAVFLVIGGVVYGVWSREATGTVLLVLGGRASRDRGRLPRASRTGSSARRPVRRAPGEEADAGLEDDQFLPHASVRPLEVGAGMTLTLAGFALGWAVLVPGLVADHPRPRGAGPSRAATATPTSGGSRVPAAMADRTLVIIKPDAVERGLTGEILARFERKGLRLVALELRAPRRRHPRPPLRGAQGKGFYDDLVAFMSRSPAVVAVVEGPEDTWKVVRTLMGPTNPREAAAGHHPRRLRHLLTENLVHGSDGPESAAREIADLLPRPPERASAVTSQANLLRPAPRREGAIACPATIRSASAATWRSTSVPPTRWSTCAATGSCSTSRPSSP